MAWLPRWLIDVFKMGGQPSATTVDPATAYAQAASSYAKAVSNAVEAGRTGMRPPTLSADPWESWYTCTDIEAWRGWVAERGLAPFSWITLPSNAQECAPTHIVCERSPLRWCLEVLQEPDVRRAALTAWLEAGAQPEDDTFVTQQRKGWPAQRTVPQGPGQPTRIRALWQLARSAEEEHLLRSQASSHWGLEIPENIDALYAAQAHALSPVVRGIVLLDNWDMNPHTMPAWVGARSVAWMDELLATANPTASVVEHAVEYRLRRMEDPELREGTLWLLERFPNIVTSLVWKSWWGAARYHHQFEIEDTSPGDPMGKILELMELRQLTHRKDLLMELMGSQGIRPAAMFEDLRVVSTEDRGVSVDTIVELGQAMARNNPAWMNSLVDELTSIPSHEKPIRNWKGLGALLSSVFGSEQDWTAMSIALVKMPEPFMVHLATSWGMPADTLLPNGASLLHSWLTDTKVPEEAVLALIEEGATGKADITRCDAHQWYTTLEQLGRAGPIADDLRQRLLVLHEQLVLADITTSVEPSEATIRTRKARL